MTLSVRDELYKIKGELVAVRQELAEIRNGGGRPVTVTLRGAERMFGVSVSTLRYLCQTGKLDGVAVKDGAKWLIHVANYERHILNKGGTCGSCNGGKGGSV